MFSFLKATWRSAGCAPGLAVFLFLAVSTGLVGAPADGDFTGVWKLNAARSQINGLPTPPDTVLKVEQTGSVLQLSGTAQEGGPMTAWTYPLDGKEVKRRVGDRSTNTVTKWEGAALLVNTLVSGSENYTVMERWRMSREGRTLIIRRTIVRLGHENESELVYENTALSAVAKPTPTTPAKPNPAASPTSIPAAASVPTTPPPSEDYVVDSGTRVLLSLVNSVNTKQTSVGDRVYLQTAYPILSHGRVVIPRGSYVTGTVTEAQRSGRVKGKPALQLRFDSLTLPNGTTRDFRSRPGNVDGQGDVSRAEGKIKGDGNKGGDARTVGETTAAGTSIGAIAGSTAGRAGMGAGIGAAAGAAAGLIGVLASRGPELILRPGTTMEMVLDRELRFTAAELR